MATTVTLHVFSGRPNPQVQLSTQAEVELKSRLRKLRTAVEAGTYENSLKLSVALDRLLEEVGE